MPKQGGKDASDADWNADHGSNFAIIDARDQKLFGSISINRINCNYSADIGYGVRRNKARAGIATRALGPVAHFRLAKMRLNRLVTWFRPATTRANAWRRRRAPNAKAFCGRSFICMASHRTLCCIRSSMPTWPRSLRRTIGRTWSRSPPSGKSIDSGGCCTGGMAMSSTNLRQLRREIGPWVDRRKVQGFYPRSCILPAQKGRRKLRVRRPLYPD